MTLRLPFCRLLAGILLFLSISAHGQRSYTAKSVLAVGNWYKIGVDSPGIYKIDLAFLSRLGVNTSNLASSSLQLFGNGGQHLPEAANGFKYDDLVENAIWVEDGGDGVINGSDYILFYADGPDQWISDSVQKTFRHQKNLYTRQSFYYLTIGTNGKRIATQTASLLPNTTINSFNSRYFHEQDTVNFLSSGKQWYGEEFSTMPGKQLNQTFNFTIPGITNQPALIISNVVARSFGTESVFSVAINSQAVAQMNVPPVSSGALDLFAQPAQTSGTFINHLSGNCRAVSLYTGKLWFTRLAQLV